MYSGIAPDFSTNAPTSSIEFHLSLIFCFNQLKFRAFFQLVNPALCIVCVVPPKILVIIDLGCASNAAISNCASRLDQCRIVCKSVARKLSGSSLSCRPNDFLILSTRFATLLSAHQP